jgi:hypothetical protein
MELIYLDVRHEKILIIERLHKECEYPVEEEYYYARDHAVAGFQPLAVRLVWISGMVSVVACRVGFGYYSVQFDVVESIDVRIGNIQRGESYAHSWKNFR